MNNSINLMIVREPMWPLLNKSYLGISVLGILWIYIEFTRLLYIKDMKINHIYNIKVNKDLKK